MPVTVNELDILIKDAFPGATVTLEEADHRITGKVRWDGFKGVELEDRSQMMRKRVRDVLGLNGMNVGVIFTLAPRERL
jgi:hypothetical protein